MQAIRADSDRPLGGGTQGKVLHFDERGWPEIAPGRYWGLRTKGTSNVRGLVPEVREGMGTLYRCRRCLAPVRPLGTRLSTPSQIHWHDRADGSAWFLAKNRRGETVSPAV